MAKKITGYIKLMIPAGKATPAPPVGPALGRHGVNITKFCKSFNAKTAEMDTNLNVPVIITVFADRSFTFEIKEPSAAGVVKNASIVDELKFESAKTGRVVKSSPAQPHLGKARIQDAVRRVVRGNDRFEKYSH